MGAWFLRLAVLGAILFVPKQAPAPGMLDESISLKIITKTYNIEGQTSQQLRKQMQERGPIDLYGVRRFGECRWKVWWDWPDQNKLLHVKVYARATLTFPKWEESDGSESSDPELRKKWENFLTRMRAHERQHLHHLIKLLPNVRDQINAAALTNPALTRKQANKIAQTVLRKIRQLDRDYDLRTQNGKLEGVVLR